MAGVEHAYQYSVEVKSRFSLFMDDAVNSQDPDLLMSKLQNERVEVAKKKKAHVLPVIKTTERKEEKEAEPVIKPEKQQAKNQPMPQPPSHDMEEHAEATEHQDKSIETPVQHVFRGRGGPRGFSRGYRGGGRGYAPRTQQGDYGQNGVDSGSQRDAYEGRGRERFRPRGGLYRGRAANTDVRELPVQADTSHERQVNRSDESPAEQDFSVGKSGAAAETNDASGLVDNQEVENVEGKQHQNNREEQEAPTYTLDEYKAMRSHEKPTVTLASKGTRKPNDGADVFANMVAHRKIVEDEVIEDEYVKVEMEEEQPNKFEINVLYNDDFGSRGRQSRGFGNRGFVRSGRARGRGPRMDRGARGTFRGDSRGHRGAPCVIYNDQEFPSLK